MQAADTYVSNDDNSNNQYELNIVTVYQNIQLFDFTAVS